MINPRYENKANPDELEINLTSVPHLYLDIMFRIIVDLDLKLNILRNTTLEAWWGLRPNGDVAFFCWGIQWFFVTKCETVLRPHNKKIRGESRVGLGMCPTQ